MRIRDAGQTGAGWSWPLWGVAAGVAGFVGHVMTVNDPGEEATRSGAGVIASQDNATYHVGVVAGIIAVFCVPAFAAGWRRWAAASGRGSLATELVSLALVASAGAMILGYGMKGSLAVYLPGGMDEGFYPAESLLSVYMFLDFAPFVAWYGVEMAIIGLAWVSLRERQLPLWLGGFAALVAVIPLVFLVGTGLPGFPGVIDPFWMVINGVAMALVLRRRAPRAVAPATRDVAVPATA